MILRLCATATLLFAALPPLAAETGTRLSVMAQPAVAAIRPVATGRTLLRLPALAYEFDIEAHCGDAAAATSLSISINDTRMTLDREQLDNPDGAPVSVTVPARQVAPVAVDGFCTAAGTESEPPQLLLRDTVTAHTSLRCTGDDREWITYASQGLDVALQCERAEPDQSDEIDR